MMGAGSGFGGVDFDGTAAAALAAADRLVPQWLPQGRREGHEWSSLNPNRSDSRRGSFKVNLRTGLWADFATGEKGGDLISLFAFIFTDGDQGKAARELASDLSMTAAVDRKVVPIKERARARSDWQPVVPVPAHAGPPHKAHPRRGVSAMFWTYHDAAGAVLGYVHRFVTSDGGKEILPSVWARNRETGREEWRWLQWAEPRPLYGLDRLAAMPDKPVLVVEGEKCADAAYRVLGADFGVVSWPGGGKAVGKVDWAPLRGRTVLIWPDADAQKDSKGLYVMPEAEQPGTVAAERIAEILLELGCSVEILMIPAPGEKANGWDVADAVADGMKREQLLAFVAHRRLPAGASSASVVPMASAKRASSAKAGDGKEQRQPDPDWHQQLKRRNGEFVPCVSNLVKIFTNDPAWGGVIGFNEFSARAVKLKPLPGDPLSSAGDWTDLDSIQAGIWLTDVYGMVCKAETVEQAMELVASRNSFHPIRDWLAELKWDGVPRLATWPTRLLGVDSTPYTELVGAWFFIGMVARVERPGCKFDSVLVLEGCQGRRKSEFLKAIGGEFFSDTELDLSNKDSLIALAGKWLHEFAEMGSISRADTNRQKAFISRTVDEYRPPYGRRPIRCPRQIAFAGTTNEKLWQKDATGGRRYWPLSVGGDADVEGLLAERDQLFAEAVFGFRSGAKYWPSAEQQRTIFDPVQLRREAEDAYLDLVHDWLESVTAPEFTLADVMAGALKLDPGRFTRDVMTRVGIVLTKLGCRRRERKNGATRYYYTLPDWTRSPAAGKVEEADDDPLPL